MTSFKELLISSTTAHAVNFLKAIHVRGVDALDFLNRQLTNDLKKLNETWQYNAICQSNGRVITTFMIGHFDDDGFVILVDESLAQNLVDLLIKFRFRAKVNFSIMDNIVSINQSIRNDIESHTLSDFSTSYCDDKYAFALNNRHYISLEKSLETVTNNGDSMLRELTIKSCFAWINSTNTEKYVAQHISLDAINAISFEKGCFPGQEIIARLHYKGKSKKNLSLVSNCKNIDVSSFASEVIHIESHDVMTEESGEILLNDQKYTVLDKVHRKDDDIFYLLVVN